MTNDPFIGQTLDSRYQVIELLGRGGMAIVYRALQPAMDREVAIKVILPDVASGEEFIQRFKNEARIVARLEHPHILPVYDYGEFQGQAYLVMRLLEAGDLQSRMMRGALSPEETNRLIGQIASALTYAHSKGVVHRDLKPQNVLMDSAGNTYLTDFGIAKAAGNTAQMTATGTIMGTPTYMAPEQWRSESVDARTDLYALGIMAYAMLSGELPYESDTPFGLMYKHLDEKPMPLEEHNSKLSPLLTSVVFKAIAKDPDDRYASAVDFAKALDAAIRGGPFAKLPQQEQEEERPSTLVFNDAFSTLMQDDSEQATMIDTAAKLRPEGGGTIRIDSGAISVPKPKTRFPWMAVLALVAVAAIIGVAAIFLLSGGDENEKAETVEIAEARGRVIVGRGLLYAEPQTTAEELTMVPEGANLQLLAALEGGRWYQVDFGGTVGWILADQIEVTGNLETIEVLVPTETPPPTATFAPSPTPAVATAVACVLTTFAEGTARTVNILQRPNASAGVVETVNVGEMLTATARTTDGWYLTPQGWVFRAVVDVSSPYICGGLPLIDPGLTPELAMRSPLLCEVVSATDLELYQGASFGTVAITAVPASAVLPVYEVVLGETGRTWYRTVWTDASGIVYRGWMVADAVGAVAGSCPAPPQTVSLFGNPYVNPLGLTQESTFVEGFDVDRRQWTTMLGGDDELVVEDGLLRFVKEGSGFQVIVPEAPELNDVIDDAYFSMRVTVPFGTEYSFEFIFRGVYTVRLTERGDVAVSLENNPSLIFGSTPDGTALLSEGVTLGVHLAGEKIIIYVNGENVLEVEDDTATEGLLPRLRIGNRAEELTVLVDDFVYWDLSE